MLNILIILVLFFIIILYFFPFTTPNEPFCNDTNEYYPFFYDPFSDTHDNFLLWDTSVKSIKNMSYDLKNDVDTVPVSLRFNFGTVNQISNNVW